MSRILFSIVIPAYNVERHIESILISLFDQWQNGVEVVVVDDGSTDKTSNIVETKFSSELTSKKIKLFKQINAGVSAARNSGLSYSSGDYIGFVDADDILMPNYISTILDCIRNRNGDVDIIEFGYKTFKSSISELSSSSSLFTNYKFGFKKAEDVLNHVYATSRWYPWTRVINRKLFKHATFPNGVRFCEDLMTVPKLYENANYIEVLNTVIYGYRINPEGATLNVQSDYFLNLVSYYEALPQSRDLRFDLLRLSIIYAIYSCNMKVKNQFEIPTFISDDIKRIRSRVLVYFYIEWRKLLIIFYPSIYSLLAKVIKLIRK